MYIYIYTHIEFLDLPKKKHPKKCRNHHGFLGGFVVDLLAWHARYQGSMDLLLGPSSWDFRMAAAQVAEEFSMPLLLWSFPESYGIGWVMPSNTMAPWIWKVAQIHGDFAGKAEFISPGSGFSWGVAGWVFVYCISVISYLFLHAEWAFGVWLGVGFGLAFAPTRSVFFPCFHSFGVMKPNPTY